MRVTYYRKMRHQGKLERPTMPLEVEETQNRRQPTTTLVIHISEQEFKLLNLRSVLNLFLHS